MSGVREIYLSKATRRDQAQLDSISMLMFAFCAAYFSTIPPDVVLASVATYEAVLMMFVGATPECSPESTKSINESRYFFRFFAMALNKDSFDKIMDSADQEVQTSPSSQD